MKKQSKRYENIMKFYQISAILWFVLALATYVVAIFFDRTMNICLGSMFLCIGVLMLTAFESEKKEESEKEPSKGKNK